MTTFKTHHVKELNPTKSSNGDIYEYVFSVGSDQITLKKNAYNLLRELRGWCDFSEIDSFIIYLRDEKYLTYSDGDTKHFDITSIIDVCAKKPEGSNHQQKIIFGPPGTGKSFSVDAIAESLCITEAACRIQTVFHPEYTYGDFIAKLMPITEGNEVKYKVVAGHFIKALAMALNNPKHNVLLQIDEINRGNCAAIFGDIFQLLDRDSSGESSYRVHLSELALKALEQELDLPQNQSADNDQKNSIQTKFNEIKKDGAYIPANLSIIATMNTSDESVYFMDSAFKRRWQFQYISADTYEFKGNVPVAKLDEANNDVQTQANANIENVTGVTWDCLRKSINNFMKANRTRIRGIEDKQIGLWFIKAVQGDGDKLKITKEDIQYKLMHYLWDNVFARDKKPLEELLKKAKVEPKDLVTFGGFSSKWNEFITEVTKHPYCEGVCDKCENGE